MRRYTILYLLLLSALNTARGQTPHNYRYWIDSNVAEQVTGTVTGEESFDIDLSSIPVGIHALHLQTQDLNGVLSPVYTRYFAKTVDTDSPLEYWFDCDVSTKKSVSTVGSIDIDVSTFTPGLHTIHYQTIGSGGIPSTCKTQFFMKMPTSNGVTMQYWFDNDWETLRSINTTSNSFALNVSGLGVGLHTLHIQTIDKSGVPSAARTQFVYVSDMSSSQLGASVWFDDNIGGATTYTLADGDPVIDISELPDGEHIVHVVLINTEGVIYGEEARMFYVGKQPGDVNGDMVVNVADIANIIDVMAAGTMNASADVNGDGVVNVADIATVIDIMAANARMQLTMTETGE